MSIDLVGAVVAWLVGVCGDAGIDLLRRGSADRHILTKAVEQAIETVVAQVNVGSQEALHLGLEQCFSSRQRISVEWSSSVGDGLRAAITNQMTQWVNSDTGRSLFQVVSFDAGWVTEQMTQALIAALRHYQASRGLTELLHGLDTADILASLDAIGARVGVWTAAGPVATTHSLPADVVSFTGREAELDITIGKLPGRAGTPGVVRIDAVDGMAGVGKTAFAVHAAHLLTSRFPDGQIFLPLHAHTPGHRPVEPADALSALLLAVGVAPQQIPAEVDARAGLWRNQMAERRMLLLLDDAASSEQVRPLLPANAGALVLVTSRHRLTALIEAVPITLDTLEAGEASRLFIRLADPSSLRSDDDSVTKVVGLCGYLPLAISLMAGQLKHHPTWTAADLAAELGSATDRLASIYAEDVSVNASFGLSYRNLSADQQRLFRLLGLHAGTDIDIYATAAVADTDLANAHKLLDDLFNYHLVDQPSRGRYRLHDLIREHARSLAASDPPAACDAAVGRLVDFYLFTARVADRHMARIHSADMAAAVGIPPTYAPDLSTREKAVTWMQAERLNLHATALLAGLHDRNEHTIAVSTAMHAFLVAQGHWDQAMTLHRAAVNAAHRTSNRVSEASVLTNLGAVQRLTGDYPAATASLTRARDVYCDIGNGRGEAAAVTYLGTVQRVTGDYPAAATNLTRARDLYHGIGDQVGEAIALVELGIVSGNTGDFPEATASLTRARDLYRGIGDQLGEATALNNLGGIQALTGDYPAAATSLTRSLDLYRGNDHRHGEVNALIDVGAVQALTGDYPAAAASLTQALHLCREIGFGLGESNALNELGTLRRMTGDYRAATTDFTLSLELYRALGFKMGEAQVLNSLGEMALAAANPVEARHYHEEALAIASDIGSPFEEARAREGTGRCDFRDGHLDQGRAALRQAMTIYQRIGSPNAQRVETALRENCQ